MGMKTMFSDSADFSNLLESPEPLKVSDVIHKAFIEVNEDGAEAAAATGKRFDKQIVVVIITKMHFHSFKIFKTKKKSCPYTLQTCFNCKSI